MGNARSEGKLHIRPWICCGVRDLAKALKNSDF